jgi:hypothetical protein
MATKDDVRDALLEQMRDPSLPSTTFDEFDRRIKLLDEE